MKKLLITVVILFTFVVCRGQSSHLYNHTFPEITSQDDKIIELLNQVNDNQIINYVNHLTSYINRRADAIHIYDVKNWLVSEYGNMGLDSVYLHDFEVIPYYDTVPRPFTSAPNVLAYKRGKLYPDEYVICGAHYDSFVITEGDYDPDTLVSPGADDNASGVAGILTTARILSDYEFERSVIFASWNAEEFGLCGSHAYAKQCKADSVDIVAYFNLDMTGYLNPGDNIHIHLLYKNCDSLLGKFVKQVGNTYFPGVNIKQNWLPYGDTDYSSFNRNGYQAISPSEDVRNLSPYIHTIDDVVGLSVNSWDQAVIFTKLNLACVALTAGIMTESVDEIEDLNENIEFFEVFDTFGRKVYVEKNVWKNIEEIRVTNLPSGIYIIRFFTKSGKNITRKFFVKS